MYIKNILLSVIPDFRNNFLKSKALFLTFGFALYSWISKEDIILVIYSSPLNLYCCLVARSCPTLCNPMDYSPPGSSVMGFPRQDYWSGLPFPSPGDRPNPGIEPGSPALQADALSSEPPGKPLGYDMDICKHINI